MNLIKNYPLFLIFTILIIFSSNICNSQPYPGLAQGEFLVINYSDTEDSSNGNGIRLLFKMYPIGGLYNGRNQYSPAARYPITYNNPTIITDSFIVGYQKILETNDIDSSRKHYVRGAFDGASSNDGCNFEFGMSLYQIEFWSVNEVDLPLILLNSFLVDWGDANMTGYYPYNADLVIEFWKANRITFYINTDTNSNHHNIDTVSPPLLVFRKVCIPKNLKSSLHFIANFTATNNKPVI